MSTTHSKIVNKKFTYIYRKRESKCYKILTTDSERRAHGKSFYHINISIILKSKFLNLKSLKWAHTCTKQHSIFYKDMYELQLLK